AWSDLSSPVSFPVPRTEPGAFQSDGAQYRTAGRCAQMPAPALLCSTSRMVDSGNAPAVTHAGAIDPVDAGDRAIFDCERQRRLRIEFESQRQRGADRAAMGDGNDVAPGMCVDQPVDRP